MPLPRRPLAASCREVASGADSERQRETDVTFDHVAHVGDAVAELQRALHAHTEGEAGVNLRVDAAGAQHIRIDHSAATPLDEAGAALLVLEPHIDLCGRLGEREEVRPESSAGL